VVSLSNHERPTGNPQAPGFDVMARISWIVTTPRNLATPARHSFPRLRGKVGMGALLAADAPTPALPRKRGRELGLRVAERARIPLDEPVAGQVIAVRSQLV